MIDYIRGKLANKLPTYVMIDVNGIGYGLHIPVSTYAELGELGSKQKLHTYLYVRDDAIRLYGFITEDERELFALLLSVRGIGPRIALGILSTLSVNELRQTINNEDVSLLTTVPGIGKKTGERLLLELRDRIGTDAVGTIGEKVIGTGVDTQIMDAMSALISLGSKPHEAAKAMRIAKKTLPEKSSLEELIKEALKHL